MFFRSFLLVGLAVRGIYGNTYGVDTLDSGVRGQTEAVSARGLEQRIAPVDKGLSLWTQVRESGNVECEWLFHHQGVGRYAHDAHCHRIGDIPLVVAHDDRDVAQREGIGIVVVELLDAVPHLALGVVHLDCAHLLGIATHTE